MRHDRVHASAVSAADDGVPNLAEALLRQASRTAPGGNGVLVDMEIDGLRCVVVRSGEVRSPAPPQRIRNEQLSPREQEIARMVGEGYPNKTIAAVLDISSWTVNTYLRRIFAKLDVTSRAAMVAKLMR
ncbi:MAG TPA: helix-turn-helix transcriptional regulator [Thermoanaerobaculia bacterium]|nr:helix-turn-helix transcriptional regulator [Thermoanaerobaculia bacterium]